MVPNVLAKIKYMEERKQHQIALNKRATTKLTSKRLLKYGLQALNTIL